MAQFYTVDRAGSLRQGLLLRADHEFSLCRFFPVQDVFTRADLEKLARDLFPNGLTPHGKRYLLDEPLVIPTPQGPAPAVPHIPMIELVAELARRAFFPARPSRLSAIFGFSGLTEAAWFRQQNGAGTIFRVSAESAFRGDMNLLYLGGSGIGALLYAMRYWGGESTAQPRWEHLLVPPVAVVEEVKLES